MSGIKDLISSLKKKKDEVLNDNQGWIRQGRFTPGKQISDYFNPTSNNGNNFWSSQGGQNLAKAQTLGEKFIANPIPSFNIKKEDPNALKVGKFLGNIPLGMANNILGKGILSPLTDTAQMGFSRLGGTSPTYNTMRSAPGRMGLQLAGKLNPSTISQYGTKYGAKQIVGNLAETASPILDAWVPNAGKKILLTGIKNGGRKGIISAVKTGAKEGSITGGGYGLLQGLADNRNVENNAEYFKNIGISTGMGATFGALLGGALRGIPEAYGQVKNIIAGKIKQIKPNITPQQAEKEAVRYIQLEGGRLAGSKPKFKNVDDVRFVGDLRESIGLSRNGDEIPQLGMSIRSKTKEEHLASQPTIKIKPSEKLPTLENPITSPQTLKLPKNQQQLNTNPSFPETQLESTSADSSLPYFNTNNLNIKDKSKTFIDKTVEEIRPEIEKVTGKKLTNQEAVDFADNSARVLNKVVTRDETLAWEAKMLKARELLAKQASEGKVTQEYLDNLLAVKSQGSDIARKLQSLSIGADPKEVTAKQAILEAILKVTDDTDALLKKAKGVDFNDYEQAASFYRQYVKPTASDWLEKIRYSSMLSSPNTHINNFSSNFQGTGIIAPIEKTISGQVDWFLSAINPKRERQQFAGEGIQYAKGYYSNIEKAWVNFKDTLSGKKLSATQEMYNLPLTEAGTKGRKVENALSFISKLLQSADEFFITLTSSGVESQLKYRISKGVKISGGPASIENKAYLEAKKRLFNSEFGLKEEGPVLKAIEYLPTKVAEARNSTNPIVRTIAKYTFPFVRVPSNILKASIEYGPMGVSTIPGASNKVEQLSKAILGTSIGLATATLVAGDRMTWAEPTDPTKKAQFRAAGMQPYAIKIGNNWVSYSKMHPAIAFNLALVAAVRDAEKNKLLDDGQVQTVLNGVAKWVNFYADMSYVKNIGDAVSGINGDLTAGTRQASNYVQQFIPFRALMGWVARIVDPYQRKVDPDGSVLSKQLQQLETQIPGLSMTVPAMKDSKGNPIENQNRFVNAFSPMRITTENPEAKKIYNFSEAKTLNTRNENVVKDRVLQSGQEEIFNGKKYYPSFETDSKTGIKTPVVKSIKVTQSMSEIYKGLDKTYEVSDDSPKNFITKIITYGTGYFKDKEGTLNAIKTGQPIRKITGDAVIVERLRGLDTLDAGDTATQVDHIIANGLGGDNSESNLMIISTQENQAKAVVDTYLINLLKSGKINKKEAQNRDANWRNEISNLSASDKSKVSNIMAKEPPKPTKVDDSILSDLSGKEYQLYDEEKQTYTNIQIKIPEYPKLTGFAETDKLLKSKYSSAISTAKTNIGKLLIANKITAEEANNALIALNAAKSKGGGKIAIKSSPKMKITKAKKIAMIKFKTPKATTLKFKKLKTAKSKLAKITKIKIKKSVV